MKIIYQNNNIYKNYGFIIKKAKLPKENIICKE